MVVISALIFLIVTSASANDSQRIIRPFYGEKDFEEYFGPGQLDFSVEEGLGKIKFLGEKARSEYPFALLGAMELLDVEKSLDELYIGRLCPNSELAAHQDYIQYLFRLASISYIEEHINNLRTHAKKLRLGRVCSKTLEEELSSCAPKGPDMKLFLKSASVLAKNFEEPSISYNFPFDNYKKNWLKEVRHGGGNTVTKRYLLYCKGHKCPLSPSKSFLKKALTSICEEDLRSFQKLCSEEDRLYGHSGTPEYYRAIVASETLRVINKNGNGPGCLARYASLMANSEGEAKNVALIGRSMYEDKRKKGALSGLAGRLFPAGSLKRFADAGLDKIFVERPKEKSAKNNKNKEKVSEVVLAPLAPEPIKQVFKKRPKVIVAKTSKPEKPTEPKKSHFLETSMTRKDLGLESAKVDMLKLKYDYIFNSKMIGYLDKEMGRFASRKGLSEMKKFDGLGSVKGPVPLLFIKYLIEENKYKELFNLIDVVGNEFFVLNNIDDKKIREKNNYVRLEFDQSAPFQWQLYVLSPPAISTNRRE